MPSPGSSPSAAELLPLKNEVLHLLLSLLDGPLHGYAMMQEVERRTGGAVRVQTGALYRFLHRMEEDGLVGESPRPEDESDERRRYYRVTAFGRAAAAAELQRMRALVQSGVEAGVLPPAAEEA